MAGLLPGPVVCDTANHLGHQQSANRETSTMKTWRKPKTTEIAVGTEINAYACAAL